MRPEDALPSWRSLAEPRPNLRGRREYRPETIPFEIEGRELWLSIAGVQFGDGTVYAFRDATSEHRLEAIRAEFVATVSHELRTPLAGLHGAALTLTTRGEELPEETRGKLLAMIANQSKRLASLVEDILLAGQLDAGSLRIEWEPFNAAAVARAAVDEARQRAATKAMLRVSASEDLPRVLGDEGRTHQVLANLIENAVKYSPAGSRVDVDVQRERGHVRFSVRDRGPGIPRGEQEHVFEKFYRLDPDHHTASEAAGSASTSAANSFPRCRDASGSSRRLSTAASSPSNSPSPGPLSLPRTGARPARGGTEAARSDPTPEA